MTVTPDTPWRSLPPLTKERFTYLLRDSPLAFESVAIHDALGADLAMIAYLTALREQGPSLGNAFSQQIKNPWLMRPRDASDARRQITHVRDGVFLWFFDYVEAAIELRYRLTDPAYKGGVYARTTSLLELNEVYAPLGDGANNPTARTAAMVIDANNLIQGETPMPTPHLIDLATAAGLAEYNRLVGPGFALSGPEVVDLLMSRDGFRTGRPEGICLHVQQGVTKGSIKDHASSARQASANAYVNLDGTIVLAVSRQFGAWTQGIKPGQSHPSPRGKAFLDRVGTTDANEAVLSIEAEGQSDGLHPPGQIDAIVWLCQEWMTNNPHIAVSEVFKHADFDVVNRSYCPGPYYDRVIAALGSTPPAEPPTADWFVPFPGMTVERAKSLFGTVLVRDKPEPFNPTSNGPISKSWYRHGLETGEWPKLGGDLDPWTGVLREIHNADGTTSEFVRFAGSGLVLWRADQVGEFVPLKPA